MPDKTQAVTALLEQYVFLVATYCIDQVDSEMQTKLIKLLVEVGREPRQADQVTLKVSPNPDAMPNYN